MLTQVRCPTCRRLTPWAGNRYRPFCSERCRVQDLGNWASDRYRVPGPPTDVPSADDTDDGSEDPDPTNGK